MSNPNSPPDVAQARAAVTAAQRAATDAQRRVNVCQEQADSQAHAIARRGVDCPPAFFVIYRERDERLAKAVSWLRACRRDVSDAQQALVAAQQRQQAADIDALRRKLTGATA